MFSLFKRNAALDYKNFAILTKIVVLCCTYEWDWFLFWPNYSECNPTILNIKNIILKSTETAFKDPTLSTDGRNARNDE